MLSAINHLTLAVADIDLALRFYVGLLGARAHARWDSGAYLSIGDLWLCLSLDAARAAACSSDYTHYAFSSDDFASAAKRLRDAGVIEWRVNQSEGNSLYFLDPDGHKLELHDGDLASRVAACRQHPYAGMVFFD
ncbi:VOC family protein [Chitinimonas sp.]|uniref:VOC family protein n=1 Tax=Chitinimonas sp. TaxID=1934313 RepID=UPI0035ADBD9B